MRKALEIAALAGLAAVWAITAYALLGPHPLPARIAIHFNQAGSPDGWGDPRALWLLPAFAMVLYGLMTIVARFTSAFNYPVYVTPANRPALENLALTMIAWLKAETIWLFVWIQHSTIEAAQGSRVALSTVSILLPIAVVFGTVGWYVVAMRKTARTRRAR